MYIGPLEILSFVLACGMLAWFIWAGVYLMNIKDADDLTTFERINRAVILALLLPWMVFMLALLSPAWLYYRLTKKR